MAKRRMSLVAPRKSLVTPRKQAYVVQSGCCFYCGAKMWLDSPERYASQHKLSLKQTQLLKCTGEHLAAHSEGGSSSASNIVAACWFCNNRRHRFKRPLSPDSYKKHVQKRLSKGLWHPFVIH